MNKSQIYNCFLASWMSYEMDGCPAEPSLLLLEKIVDKYTDTECYVFKDTKHDSVIFAFRGTKGFKDILTDLTVAKQKVFQASDSYYVHKGFWESWFSVEEKISFLAYEYVKNKEKIIFAGHSLGGSLATVGASRLNYLYPSVVTFGSPRTGDRKFKNLFNEKIKDSTRIVLDDDLVPILLKFGYRHVRQLIHLDEDGNIIKYNLFKKIIRYLSGKDKFDLNDHQLQSYNDAILKWMNPN